MEMAYVLKDVNTKNKAVLHFGELFLSILPYLKRPVSAEYISQQLKIKPSRIRAVLNKLFNYNLIEYKRSFDDDTGRYTYIWTLKHDKLREFLSVQEQPAPEVHDEGIKYVCTGCGMLYDFDTAFDYGFKCYHCGSFIDSKE